MDSTAYWGRIVLLCALEFRPDIAAVLVDFALIVVVVAAQVDFSIVVVVVCSAAVLVM